MNQEKFKKEISTKIKTFSKAGVKDIRRHTLVYAVLWTKEITKLKHPPLELLNIAKETIETLL